MSIGEVADPPFAVLPDPATLFSKRSARLAALAPNHPHGAYLSFLASLCAAQHAALDRLPEAQMPEAAPLSQALRHAMPPLGPTVAQLNETADATLSALLAAVDDSQLPASVREIVTRVRTLSPADRRKMMDAVRHDEIPADEIAEHVLAAAALQVHMTRLAARLDAKALKRVADGACPACGGAPLASAIVGWEGAHGTRFCTCSLCATQWNVPRIRCLSCGTEKGIAYHSIEGSDGHLSGETCESCRSYVKMLHQHKDAALEPLADDVASLTLDMVLEKEGWRRASVNPFLMGY